jgi:hypothetical protein
MEATPIDADVFQWTTGAFNGLHPGAGFHVGATRSAFEKNATGLWMRRMTSKAWLQSRRVPRR